MSRGAPRSIVALALLLPLLGGCAGMGPADDSALLQQEIRRLEWELAGRDELSQELLLSQAEEFRHYHRDLLARLDRIAQGVQTRAAPAPARACPPPQPEEKLVLGRLERVQVDGIPGTLKARVDTGAGTSSLHAEQIVEFERDGARWVRFRTFGQGDGSTELEAPVERYIRVRQASTDGVDRRPVVKLGVQLGRIEQSSEFSLTDREGMLYPVLLGRSFFMDIAVVDVSRKFVETQVRPEAVQAAGTQPRS